MVSLKLDLCVLLHSLAYANPPANRRRENTDSVRLFATFPHAVVVFTTLNETCFKCLSATRRNFRSREKTVTYVWHLKNHTGHPRKDVVFDINFAETPGEGTFFVNNDKTRPFRALYKYSDYSTCAVCERHFEAEDIVRETSYIAQATGRTVTAPLSRLQLRAEAVPTVFPDCPSYLSIETSRREDPESKRMRLEAASLEKVLAESILTAKKEEEADKLCDLKDVANFVPGKKLTFWHVIECSDHVILAHICNDGAPWIKYSLVVKTDLTLTVNVAKASVKRLGSKMVVPSVIASKRRLLDLLEGVEGFDSAQRSSSENSTAYIFETVASLLNELIHSTRNR
ncbi:hypothetical protein MRX96_026638 [Rhipicephalus microplus]